MLLTPRFTKSVNELSSVSICAAKNFSGLIEFAILHSRALIAQHLGELLQVGTVLPLHVAKHVISQGPSNHAIASNW